MEFVLDGNYCNNSSSSSSSSTHRFSAAQGVEAGVGDLRRGPWTVEEDLKLVTYISTHGEGRWNTLARCAGLKRTGKSCRLRWLNYLRPDVRRGNITPEEQLLILQLHSRWGNRWSKIAQHLPGRTDNEIKNYWRTRVQKHAKQLKCDVNSQRFKDVMQYLWIPRLVERIHADSGRAPATAVPTTTSVAIGTLPTATGAPAGDPRSNEFMMHTKLTSPESSSVDTLGTTTTSQPPASPPMSDFADHVVDWGDDIPAAPLGFNDDMSREIDNGWGFDDRINISDSFWSSMDDIWSLQQ